MVFVKENNIEYVILNITSHAMLLPSDVFNDCPGNFSLDECRNFEIRIRRERAIHLDNLLLRCLNAVFLREMNQLLCQGR